MKQVRFKYNEVINELEEMWAYKDLVRQQFKAVHKQLREVSIRATTEGRIISDAFGDNYPNEEYKATPPRQAPARDDDGNILRLPSGGDKTYTGNWTTFQIRNESMITKARSDEIAHRLYVHQVYSGGSGNSKAKLNQRIRQLIFQHNMVKHLTKIDMSPWHGYTNDTIHISGHTSDATRVYACTWIWITNHRRRTYVWRRRMLHGDGVSMFGGTIKWHLRDVGLLE